MEGKDFLYLQFIGVAHEFQGKGFGGRWYGNLRLGKFR
jgi:hypothetical protein